MNTAPETYVSENKGVNQLQSLGYWVFPCSIARYRMKEFKLYLRWTLVCSGCKLVEGAYVNHFGKNLETDQLCSKMFNNLLFD